MLKTSATFKGDSTGRERLSQTSRGGVTTSTPNMSPSHHFMPTVAASLNGTKPLDASVSAPTSALIRVLIMAASTVSAKTSRLRSSAPRKCATRSNRKVPVRAATVFPVAIQAAANRGMPVQALARNAPSATPIAMREPKASIAASAMPLGAQTNVTVLPTTACVNPPMAATA